MLDIDIGLKPQKIELFLTNPQQQTIAKLNESYNIVQNLKLGNINELSFSLPYEVDINHELKRNPNIDKVKQRFYIKSKLGTKTEWYIISEIQEQMDDSGDSKHVVCYSIGYELADKLIRRYEVESYTPSQVLNDLLSDTLWSVGTVDSEFATKYRAFNFSSTTVLDSIFRVAETFNAIIDWDTETRTINLIHHSTVGNNLGLRIGYGKYLQAMNKEERSNEMATRFRVYGSNGMSIQSVNPTGQPYIENFSYFLYPFERDVNKNTIQKSDYMSEELCHAILDYQELLESKDSQFSTLLTDKQTLETQLTSEQNTLDTLQTELEIIQDELDVANATGGDTVTLITQKNAKESEIDNQQSLIDSIEADIDLVDADIETLRDGIKLENNFTPELIQERSKFIIEKEWVDENYTDPQELYDAAKERFIQVINPKLILDIDIVNFLEIIEEQKNWGKLNLGDTINISYDKMNTNVSAKIIEVEFNYEDGTVNLVIANIKNNETDEDTFMELLNKSMSTSTTVDMDKYKWNKSEENATQIEELIDNVWDANKREIQAGVNNSVEIGKRGIKIIDPMNPQNILIAQNGVLGISNDGGDSWKHAVTANGIVGEQIYGKLGVFATVRADQIILGDNNEKIPDSVIGSADTWNSAEANAKLYADGLKETIDSNIDDIDGRILFLENEITEGFRDGIISEAESISISSYINQLNSEKEDIDNQYNKISTNQYLLDSTNLDTVYTEYNTAHTNLIASINNAIADRQTTQLEKDDVDAKFVIYKNKLGLLSTEFQISIDTIATQKASEAESNANSYTDGIKTTLEQEIDDIDGRVTTLQTDFDNMSLDGVIDEAESLALKSNIDILNSEKLDLDSRYSSIYNNTYLQTVTIKNDLFDRKTEYDTAHTNLITTINNAVADNVVTETEKTDVETKFNEYRIALANLTVQFEVSIDDISSQKANEVAENSMQLNQNLNSTYITQDGIVVKNFEEVNVVKMGEFDSGQYGLRAIHADGTYTQITDRGLERWVAGEAKPYMYLTQNAQAPISNTILYNYYEFYIDYVDYDSEELTSHNVGNSPTYGALVDKSVVDAAFPNITVYLPADFIGKNYTVTLFPQPPVIPDQVTTETTYETNGTTKTNYTWNIKPSGKEQNIQSECRLIAQYEDRFVIKSYALVHCNFDDNYGDWRWAMALTTAVGLGCTYSLTA